jgi:hypothetical protein
MEDEAQPKLEREKHIDAHFLKMYERQPHAYYFFFFPPPFPFLPPFLPLPLSFFETRAGFARCCRKTLWMADAP